MDKDILETVLTDMLEEQKTTNKFNDALTKQMKEMQEKIDDFGSKLEKLQVIAPPADTKAVQKAVNDGMDALATMIESQPKNVIHQKRVLLFPETNMGQYYRIIFGRLIPWGLAFAGMCFVFSIIGKAVDTSTEVNTRKYYYEWYSSVLSELDSTLDKSGRQKLRAAWTRAGQRHDQ
jgi:hypothetical protein